MYSNFSINFITNEGIFNCQLKKKCSEKDIFRELFFEKSGLAPLIIVKLPQLRIKCSPRLRTTLASKLGRFSVNKHLWLPLRENNNLVCFMKQSS